MTSLLAAAVIVGFQRPALKPHPFFAKPITNGAHRGGMALWPENTSVAYANCGKAHPDALLETDATLTRDGVVVLLHDETVDRTTNGKGTLTQMTFSEVRQLDGAYNFTRDGGKTYPYRGQGVKITTLAEALQAAPKSRFMIDIKHDAATAEAVIKVVRAERASDRVLLASFITPAMERVRQLAPEMPRCYDARAALDLLTALRGGKWDAYVPTDDVLTAMTEQVEQAKLTPAEIRAIRAKGILLHVHTLNSRAEIDHWRSIGIDGMLTDNPDLID